MQIITAGFHENLTGELVAALVLYAAGYATNEFFDIINRKRKLRLMKHHTQVAFRAIELAEEKFPGPHQGSKKLEFATNFLLTNSNIKKYQDAQNLILQCFPLTTLANNNLKER